MAKAEYAAGLLYGIFAAGPAFVAGLGIVEIAGARAALPTQAGLYAALAVLSVPFGAIIGCVPVMFGTGVLGWLGKYNIGSRLPPVWALAGAAMAGVPAWMVNHREAGDAMAAFAIAGALSALAARAGTRWVDDDALHPPCSYADR
ncbi:hypothetical protein [Sphingomonas sp.]|jgi:hypothetical protein|uniref:hypothetical protein n=1 Tax=Sphingomonas sp. TaxID=28214 RepID=UPI002DBECF8B|nr:hypothetical protein [Sphingomonas sp.]HEU4969588.1 hypothetical protein [Sphingomonas sp.]